ncbi:MAG TPA: hypothetical protein VF989_06480 [Polyangiaceae bacterium]|jgi:hypothetical protein
MSSGGVPVQRAWRRTACLLAAWVLGGCTYSSVAELAARRGPTDPASVRVLAGNGAGRPHQVLGVVAVQSDGEDPEDVLEELRIRAAEIGADAVVDTEIHFGMGVWSAGLRASGAAVKFQ